MSSPKKYEPPETVVGPAFSELLNRLARSRVHIAGGMEMSEEEQKIFDYGVSERKRVLEHTLFLVFGQWAVYRQLISRLQSRGLRVAYGVGAVVSSGYFLGIRAKRVSHEMFATIATTATTSPLGNEARIVLAELEGPDGPYFRRICRDKSFSEDLPSVIAALDAKDGIDPASDHVHPQLRLRPRLPGPQHAHDEITRVGKARERRDMHGGAPPDVDSRPARVQRGRAYMQTADKDDRFDVDRDRRDYRESKRGPSRENVKEIEDDLWGKPFDFKKAAGGAWDDNPGRDAAISDGPVEPTPNNQSDGMTPSQRRAAERRARRMHSKKRWEQNGEAGQE